MELSKRIIFTLFFTLFSFGGTLWGQSILGVKTNLLYGGARLTPNLGVEIGVGQRSTIDLWGGYNPWNRKGSLTDNKKLVHWIIQPEYRFWLCERFNGHFFGIHGTYADYNISGYNIPLLLENNSKNYRYKGTLYGGGFSYGYQLIFSKSWNMEFNIGAGYLHMQYDKYSCLKCSKKTGTYTRNYFGPTRAGITIVLLLGKSKEKR